VIVGERFHYLGDVIPDGPTNAVESDHPVLAEALECLGRDGDGARHLGTADQGYRCLVVRADARGALFLLHHFLDLRTEPRFYPRNRLLPRIIRAPRESTGKSST